MNTLKSALLVALAFVGAGTFGAEAAPDPAKLIKDLNSDDFDARDTAARDLAKLGEAARPALEKAFAAGDADTKDAIQAILARMSQSVLEVQAYDRDGKPVPDAQADAQIYEADDMYARQPQAQTVNTGADGSAQLPPCKPGTYQFYFNWKKSRPAGNGYVGGRIKLLDGKNRTYCTLSPGGTLQMLVSGEDSKPIKDAKVTTVYSYYVGAELDADALTMLSQQNGRQDVKSADTGADGIAKLEGVPMGIVQCLITHENFEAAATPLYRIHDGQTTEATAVTLKPKAPGKLQLILTKDDGKPLAKTSVIVTLKKKLDPEAEKKATRSRMQAQMWFGRMGNEQGEPTDEAGKLLKDNVASGTYRLTIQTGDANGRFMRGRGRNQGDTLQFVSEEVTIKPGATTELTLKPVTGGVLTGQILTDKETGIQFATVTAIPEADYINADPNTRNQLSRYAYGYGGTGDIRFEQTGNDGAYKFTRLKPGRYVLSVQDQNGNSAIVYGVEIVEGKDAAAPKVKFTAPTKAFKELKVHVSLPDGHPAAGAMVTVVTVSKGGGGSSTGGQTDADGNMHHQVNEYQVSLPNRLSISLAGYKPANVDLTAPEVKPEDVSVTLQKRNYQKLTVKTVDEAGKPVAGVQVWPFGKDHVNRGFNGNTTPGSRMKRTDKEGQAHFDGLLDGKRGIRVEADEYFADDASLAVDLAADNETLHTVVLHKGLTLSGKVSTPEGIPVEKANAVLSGAMGTTIHKMIGADGEFKFTGLAPGDYSLWAEAPGCQMGSANKTVTLEKDKPAEAATLPLIRYGGAAIRAGTERAGMRVSLFPPDFWKDPDYTKYWAHQSASDTVDGQGRAELWAPPGDYMVMLSPGQMQANYAQQQPNTTALTPLAGPITVQPLKSSAELTSLKGDEIKVPVATASFTLTVIPELPDGVDKEKMANTYVSLLIVGQKATGSIYVNHVNHNHRINGIEEKPLIIGTPPPGLKTEVEIKATPVTTVTTVPEGDYKIYSQNYRPKKGEPKQPLKPLLEFSIKDGETKDLGELKVALPAPTKEELEQQQENRNEWWLAQEEDKIDNFKP